MTTRTQSITDRIEKYSARHYRRYPGIAFDEDPRNKGVWVYDCEGRKYLDMFATYSALSIGHNHRKIKEVMAKHYAILAHGYPTAPEADLLESLCRISGMDKVLPMNTGVEAVETALKLARKWARVRKGIFLGETPEIIFAEQNFHGRTLAVIGASSYVQYRDVFGPPIPGLVRVPYGDITAMRQAINPHTAAVILEPVQGEAGVIIPPEEYPRQVYDLCKTQNVLFMLDEVQTGFGRTGKMFRFQHDNTKPDVLIVAKALGGGQYPVSAVLAPQEIMDVFEPGDHGSTFAGNALACAIGAKTIEILERTDKRNGNLVVNSEHLGVYLLHELTKIQSPFIKELRGCGLFIGVELTEDAGDAFDWSNELLAHGVMCGVSHEHVLRLSPPLIITKKELDDWFLPRFEDVVKKFSRT